MTATDAPDVSAMLATCRALDHAANTAPDEGMSAVFRVHHSALASLVSAVMQPEALITITVEWQTACLALLDEAVRLRFIDMGPYDDAERQRPER